MPPLPSQAGGVDQDERPVSPLEHGVDCVARRPRDLADYHAFPAEQGVDEARLADVRTAEDRHANRVFGELRPLGGSDALELLDDAVEQVAGARPGEAGDGDRVAEAEPVELERERLLLRG